jgi:aspartyl-tRNA synthetase
MNTITSNSGKLKRTHKCTEVSENDIGKVITASGWVQTNRDLGGVIFIDLRDITGILQLVFRVENNPEIFKLAEKLRSEFVISVKGSIEKRSDETINDKLKTGYIELVATEMEILSKSETPPFNVEEDSNVNEATRLKYRYIDLRRPDMQKNMILRHEVMQFTRRFFSENNFLEIETPMLNKSTPEGARDYLVPSRVHNGKFYALPQSPQLFKQLLMVSGYDRYFQITKCFRDEDLRADRQPEFTQIDLEMSFVDVDDVIEINEKFIKELFAKTNGLELNKDFPRMTYKEAMERYGSDKPDTRFDIELVDISDVAKECGFKVFSQAIKKGGSVRAINAKGCAEKFSRREIDSLVDFVKTYRAKGMAWIAVEENELKSVITKFFKEEEIKSILERVKAEPGDLICFVADKNEIVFDALGNLRLEVARKLGILDNNTDFNFLWITEFPLLEYDEKDKRWYSKHHPFTSPYEEDIEFMESDPERVRAKAYDLVINGVELGGGSIRIHNQDLQMKMFETLGFTEEQSKEQFGFLLEAFKYGTPPHGGLAYGLDRILMIAANKSNIKDVIAFPKVQNASCLMTEAPSEVEKGQLNELGIRLLEL